MKLTLLLLIGSLAACSGTSDGMAAQRVVDSSGGSVALGIDSALNYKPITVPAGGAVSGVVSLNGGPAADSTVAVRREPASCGDSASQTSSGEPSLAGVLVWVDGIEAGKPVSAVKRETITIEHCRFAPRIIVVRAGATINVFSRDQTSQTWRFYREGGSEPIEEVRTVDAGQVVPSEKIARVPGMVEARSEQHTWSRAFIAVFDHPYHAVTDAAGAFTIDSLPPGTYTIKLWHERMTAPVEQRVVVNAGGTGRLDVAVTLGN